jgi:hypothetical protein
MTSNISEVQDEQRSPAPDLSVLAEQLVVAAARSEGVEPTAPGGLLTGLTQQVLGTALDVELSDHLGHDRGERSGSGNVRSGSSGKTVRTDVGEMRINVPRDRAGTFTPAGGAHACPAADRLRRRGAQPVGQGLDDRGYRQPSSRYLRHRGVPGSGVPGHRRGRGGPAGSLVRWMRGGFH